jgi:ATP-dependent Clp protease ATP-binding subunit ClpX
MTQQILCCSVCGKSPRDQKDPNSEGIEKLFYLREFTIQTSKGLVKGEGFICNECIELISKAAGFDVHATATSASAISLDSIISARSIKELLDEHVIGQENAKKTIATAAGKHMRISEINQASPIDERIEKSNILILGPTGTGKTYVVENLARILDRPFYKCNAPDFTAAGYVGKDVEDIVLGLIAEADDDIERAQKGIIYIDEVDKIAKNSGRSGDVGGEAVQQAILKMVEGTELEITVRQQGGKKTIKFDTSNVLFVCSGAFARIEDIVKARITSDKKGIGFGAAAQQVEADVRMESFYSEVTTDDLVKFGMIPEFLGRLPVRAVLDPLQLEDLVNILTKPKNAITKQFIRYYEADDVTLTFEEGALEEIALQSQKRKLGARGLKTMLTRVMEDHDFNIGEFEEGEVINITKEYVLERLKGFTPES